MTNTPLRISVVEDNPGDACPWQNTWQKAARFSDEDLRGESGEKRNRH